MNDREPRTLGQTFGGFDINSLLFSSGCVLRLNLWNVFCCSLLFVDVSEVGGGVELSWSKRSYNSSCATVIFLTEDTHECTCTAVTLIVRGRCGEHSQRLAIRLISILHTLRRFGPHASRPPVAVQVAGETPFLACHITLCG